MLEVKSLLVGLVFAVGLFGAKTGTGLSYFAAQQRSAWRKDAVLVVIAAGYFAIFLIAWYVCSRVDMVSYFNRVRTFFQSNMTLHAIVALGMFFWGLALLRRPSGGGERRCRGWLSLVIPCPVCAAVILFTTGFLVSLFPDESLRVSVGTYALFAAVMLITFVTLSATSRFGHLSSEQGLAFGMLFTASYFALSVFLVPHFSDVDKVYRLAVFHSSRGSVDPGKLAGLLIAAILAVSAGFLVQRLRQRSVR